jgi:hypothetical protein
MVDSMHACGEVPIRCTHVSTKTVGLALPCIGCSASVERVVTQRLVTCLGSPPQLLVRTGILLFDTSCAACPGERTLVEMRCCPGGKAVPSDGTQYRSPEVNRCWLVRGDDWMVFTTPHAGALGWNWRTLPGPPLGFCDVVSDMVGGWSWWNFCHAIAVQCSAVQCSAVQCPICVAPSMPCDCCAVPHLLDGGAHQEAEVVAAVTAGAAA